MCVFDISSMLQVKNRTNNLNEIAPECLYGIQSYYCGVFFFFSLKIKYFIIENSRCQTGMFS